MSEPKTHEEYGKLSGFPKCCRTWFLVRLFLINITSYLKLTRSYSNWLSRKFNTRHILCPFHQILTLTRLYKPKYFTCQECGWFQLGRGPCSIQNAHQTWRAEQIVDMVLRCKKQGFDYKYGGRIGRLLNHTIKTSRKALK